MSTAKTRPFPDKLLATVEDILSNSQGSTLKETPQSAYISVKDPKMAEILRGELQNASWNFSAADQGGPRTVGQAFEADFAPFEFDIKKPETDDGVVLLVHPTSLIEILKNHSPQILRVGKGTPHFELHSTIVCNWEEPVQFDPAPLDAEPKRLVRDLSANALVPTNLSIWFLQNIDDAPFGDEVFEIWKCHAASVYLRILCSEIEPDCTLLFRSQPVLRIAPMGPTISISAESFRELHSLATWVYETKREAETRHGLAVAEIARAAINAKDANEVAAKGFRGILESARQAYQLGLHKLSKDALQALADLRKSVGDETSKAADFTRQMTTSVAGALFAAVGVLAARLTLAKDNEAFSLVAVVVGVILFVYVCATARSGWYFIGIQRGLRAKWKERTSKFLTAEEYADLVEAPANQAERAYDWTAWISIFSAFAAMFIVSWFSYPDAIAAAWQWFLTEAEACWNVAVKAISQLSNTSNEVPLNPEN